MSERNQRGFSAVEAIVILVIAVGIAAVGYFVYSRMQDDKKSAEPSSSQQAETASTPATPSVSDTKDLDTAEQALDETNLNADTTDSNDLDTQLNAF